MQDGRIPMYIEEGEAVDELIATYGPGSVSRSEPDDQGTLLYKVADGRVWEIDGKKVKLVREAAPDG